MMAVIMTVVAVRRCAYQLATYYNDMISLYTTVVMAVLAVPPVGRHASRLDKQNRAGEIMRLLLGAPAIDIYIYGAAA